ncbi:MAG TPA: uroporphyrinogen-III synthase [Candidatus Angelobacter sp.]|nr:uroporphyrinogen-III synthase [Candidatus Angelobacter sp.]
MTLRALVTRPEEDAAPLAAALAERGIDVTLEPLLAIRPLPEAPIDLAGVQALLFTSANGVRSFAELAGGRDLAGWRELPVFAVGNATAAAAHSVGFARVESAAGDVNALAKLVAERLDPNAGALFHAAGSAVAGDLAGLLEQAGFMLRREMLYEARPADQLSAATVTNLANGWFDLVLFFSPRTAATFVALARAAGGGVVTGCGKAAALCLSPAVAAAAGELPWREVQAAARPELPALLDLVDRELAARAENAEKESGRAAAPAGSADAAAPVIEPLSRRRSRLGAIVVTAAATAVVVALATNTLWNWWQGPDPVLVQRLSDLEKAHEATASGVSIMRDDVGTLIGKVRDASDRVLALETAAQGVSGGSAPDLTPLTKRLDVLEQEVATLHAAGRQPVQTTPGADVAALSEKIAALEAKLAALQTQPAADGAAPAADVAALSDRLATLETQLAALRPQPPNGTAADTAAIDKLSQENAVLRGDIAALKAQLAAIDQALTARGQDAGGVAFALAVGNLGGALSTARPFAAELTALTELAAKDPALAAQVKTLTAPLAERAAVGVPTLVELQSRFPATARAIVDAAKQTAPATVENPESRSWYERPLGWLSSAGDWLASQISVRPVGDVAGDDAGARVARAEVRLSQNDLAAAAKELEGLSGPPATAAAAWLGDAQARLAVEQVVTALQAAAVTRLGASAAGTGGAGG